MLADRDPWSGRRAASRLRWAERLLVAAGGVTLVWCALVVADARVFQTAARRSLDRATEAAPTYRPEPDTGVQIAVPIARGSAVGDLSIPRIRLSSVVLHGSDARTLGRGPGHLEETPLPGEPGNVAIAGHRDSFFRRLRYIRVGDDIWLKTPRGRFHYRVSSLRVIRPDDVSVIAPTRQEVLTLITCYPFRMVGRAPDRFVVRAARVVDVR
jgi:sortase A